MLFSAFRQKRSAGLSWFSTEQDWRGPFWFRNLVSSNSGKSLKQLTVSPDIYPLVQSMSILPAVALYDSHSSPREEFSACGTFILQETAMEEVSTMNGSESALNSSFNSVLSGFESLLRKQMRDDADSYSARNSRRTDSEKYNSGRYQAEDKHHRISGQTRSMHDKRHFSELNSDLDRHESDSRSSLNQNEGALDHTATPATDLFGNWSNGKREQSDRAQSRMRKDLNLNHNTEYSGATANLSSWTPTLHYTRASAVRARSAERVNPERSSYSPRNNSADRLDNGAERQRGRSVSPHRSTAQWEPSRDNDYMASIREYNSRRSHANYERKNDNNGQDSLFNVTNTTEPETQSRQHHAKPLLKPALVTARTTPVVTAKPSVSRALFQPNGSAQNGHREVRTLLHNVVETNNKTNRKMTLNTFSPFFGTSALHWLSIPFAGSTESAGFWGHNSNTKTASAGKRTGGERIEVITETTGGGASCGPIPHHCDASSNFQKRGFRQNTCWRKFSSDPPYMASCEWMCFGPGENSAGKKQLCHFFAASFSFSLRKDVTNWSRTKRCWPQSCGSWRNRFPSHERQNRVEFTMRVKFASPSTWIPPPVWITMTQTTNTPCEERSVGPKSQRKYLYSPKPNWALVSPKLLATKCRLSWAWGWKFWRQGAVDFHGGPFYTELKIVLGPKYFQCRLWFQVLCKHNLSRSTNNNQSHLLTWIWLCPDFAFSCAKVFLPSVSMEPRKKFVETTERNEPR